VGDGSGMWAEVSVPAGKTEVVMRQEAQERADLRPLIVSCAVEGCAWRFEGAAGGARDRARAHREAVHPELGAGRPREFQNGQGAAFRLRGEDGKFGCKIDGCEGRAHANRGAYAYLCPAHAEGQRDHVSAKIKEAVRRDPAAAAPELGESEGRDPLPTSSLPWDADALMEEAAFLRLRAEALEGIAEGIRALGGLR
jgi:hypothetical protein